MTDKPNLMNNLCGFIDLDEFLPQLKNKMMHLGLLL